MQSMIEGRNEKLRYTREEAAKYISAKLFISLKPGTLSTWAWKKKRDSKFAKNGHDLKFVKDGHAVHYRKADLDAYIENRLKKMFTP